MVDYLQGLNRNHILSVLPIAVALINIFTFLNELATVSNFAIWMISLAALVLALWASKQEQPLRWLVYIRVAPIICWMLLGIIPTLWLILIGTPISHLIELTTSQDETPHFSLSIIATWITINGLSALILDVLYRAMDGTRPFSGTAMADIWLVLAFALVVSAFVAHGLTILIWDKTLQEALQVIAQHGLTALFITLVSVTVSLIQIELGFIPFAIGMLLTGAQIVQQRQVVDTQVNLAKRLHDMATINTLSHEISTNVELDAVLENLHREVRELIDAETFFIALYDDEQNMIEYPLVYDGDVIVEWASRKMDNKLSDYVIRQQKSLLVKVSDKDRLQNLNVDLTSMTDRVYIGVPLMVADKIIGAMGVGNRHNASALNDDDVQLLETVASQASLALRNATLYDRATRLAKNVSEVNYALQDIMFNLDKDDALFSACEIAIRLTQAEKVAIYLPEVGNSQYRFYQAQVAGRGQYTIPSLVEVSSPPNDVSIIEKSDDPAIVGDYTLVVRIPLRSGNTNIGLLILFHVNNHHPEATEINLLEVLAKQITAALDNADLLQALELYAAEQAQLVHLSRISSANLDLDRIIIDVCRIIRQMMVVSHAEIVLLQPEGKLVEVYRPNPDIDMLQTLHMSLSEIPEFSNITDYATIQTFDKAADSLSSNLKRYMSDLSVSVLGLVPMRINNQLIGMIVLGDIEPRTFNDNDNRLLQMAAYQVSAQVHNARIHLLTEEALVQRLEQLSLIEDIAQQISRAMDPNLVIDNVLDAALQATQSNLAALVLTAPDNSNRVEVIYKEYRNGKVVTETIDLPVQGVFAHVLQTGEILTLNDNRLFADYYAPTDIPYLSSLVVPLVKADEIIGVLNLENTQLNYYTNEQASFIRSLAGHAAISIDNARLLEERERQINTLTLLRSLSLETLSVMEQRRIAQSILRAAIIILDGQSSVMFVRSGSYHSFTQLEGISLEGGMLHDSEPDIPLELIIQAAFEGKAITVEDTSNHPAYLTDFDNDHHAAMVIPIHRRNQVREVLCVTFKQTRTFSAQDLNTIDLLAVQSASHLENAELNEAIRSSNDRMRAILDSTRDGIVLLDVDGHVQDANIAADQMTQIRWHTYLQKPLKTLLDIDIVDGLDDMLTVYINEPNDVHEQEYELHHEKDTLYIKTLITPVEDKDNVLVGYLLILRDITEEKELEAYRDKLQDMVLHDLRSPLGSIISSMYLALAILDDPQGMPLDEAIKPTVEVSLQSSQNLLALVETLRELPQIPGMVIKPEIITVQDIADEASQSLKFSLQEAGIDVVHHILDDLRPLYVDNDLIRRVLTNLMHNAYKFTPENGTIQISATNAEKQRDYLQIMVSDTGPGIPEDQRERIFGEFIQIDGHRPRPGPKGTGLGLNFCKLAVEAHGGRIWVEADGPLSGATFAFTLPAYTGVVAVDDAQRVERPALDWDE